VKWTLSAKNASLAWNSVNKSKFENMFSNVFSHFIKRVFYFHKFSAQSKPKWVHNLTEWSEQERSSSVSSSVSTSQRQFLVADRCCLFAWPDRLRWAMSLIKLRLHLKRFFRNPKDDWLSWHSTTPTPTPTPTSLRGPCRHVRYARSISWSYSCDIFATILARK